MKLGVPDVIKKINVKVLSSNEARHIKWYETCEW